MASAGVAALSAGPALAQQDSRCAQRLDQMEQQLQQIDTSEQRRADVKLIIDGARTLADVGDEQGCENVLGELEPLMRTVAEAGPGASPQEEATPAEEIAGASDVATPHHQVRQSIDAAQMALQQDDLETARGALEEAQQTMQKVAGQAGGEVQPQLGEVEEAIRQALDAIGQDDVGAAQQALDRAKVPMQQAMLEQPPEQRPQGGGQAQRTGEATSESLLAQVPASDLLGSEVVDDQGDTVAEIVDLVKRSDDDSVYAVLSVGGFLGLGVKEVAMPLDRLHVGAGQDIVLSNANEDELERMPAWQKDDPAYQALPQ